MEYECTEIKDYNPAFTKAYELLKKHISIASEQQFADLSQNLGHFKTQFELDLCLAVIGEIERRYRK